MVDLIKKVVIQVDGNISLESFLIEDFVRTYKSKLSDCKFYLLRDLLTDDDQIEASFGHNLAVYVGIEPVRDAYAVIWAPNTESEDWFARLTKEGYTGERILLRPISSDYDSYDESSTYRLFYPSYELEDTLFQLLKD